MGYIGAGISRFNTADELTVTGDATIDTTTLVVDSTNNRVGVGTASPATALDVTGTVTADGVTSDGDLILASTGNIKSTGSIIYTVDSDNNQSDRKHYFRDGSGAERLVIDESGDISFYADNGTTQGLFWDASTQRLGLGTTSPARPLHLQSSSGGGMLSVEKTSATTSAFVVAADSGAVNLFARDTNSGSGNVPLGFNIGSTRAMTIDSSRNVGIGSAAPAYSLDVFNSASSGAPLLAQFKSAGGDTQLYVDNSTITTQLTADATNSAGIVGTKTNHSFVFRTNNAERMRLTSAGSLGLGTASPDALLQIEKSDSGTTIDKEPSSQSGPNIAIHNSNQTANNLSSIQFTNRGTNGVAETATAGIHVKHEAQGGTYSYGSMNFNVTDSAGSYATRMHISSDGKIGIGTVSPTASKLQVDGTDGTIARFRTTSGSNNTVINIASNDSAGTAGLSVGGNSSFPAMTFENGGSERMRILSGGQICAGTTSANGSEILQLSAGGVQWSTGPNTTNGSFDVFNASGTGVYLSSGSTAWSGISDERYKDIIEPIINASEKVSALRPIIGKYKTDEADVRRSFLIAQDVQAVFPEAVDAQDESKLGLRYADLIPLLTGALQEAIAKIETLEARIATLEAE